MVLNESSSPPRWSSPTPPNLCDWALGPVEGGTGVIVFQELRRRVVRSQSIHRLHVQVAMPIAANVLNTPARNMPTVPPEQILNDVPTPVRHVFELTRVEAMLGDS